MNFVRNAVKNLKFSTLKPERPFSYPTVPPHYLEMWKDFSAQNEGKEVTFSLKMVGKDSNGDPILVPNFKAKPVPGSKPPLKRSVSDSVLTTKDKIVKSA